MIGCSCAVCRNSKGRNRRWRPSGLLRTRGKQFLIDSGPDFREQALHFGIDHLDGVLITHTHFDHIAGLDELRSFYLVSRTKLPVLVSEASLKDLQARYDYLFQKKAPGISLSAQLDFQVLQGDRGETQFLGVPLRYVSYEQGGMQVNGYRFGPLAYISDIRHYPETLIKDLQGVEILILSVLRREASFMHFSIKEGIEFAKEVGAERTYFTHIGHELEHESTEETLPKGFNLAYDGLILEI